MSSWLQGLPTGDDEELLAGFIQDARELLSQRGGSTLRFEDELRELRQDADDAPPVTTTPPRQEDSSSTSSLAGGDRVSN